MFVCVYVCVHVCNLISTPGGGGGVYSESGDGVAGSAASQGTLQLDGMGWGVWVCVHAFMHTCIREDLRPRLECVCLLSCMTLGPRPPLAQPGPLAPLGLELGWPACSEGALMGSVLTGHAPRKGGGVLAGL